MDNKRLNQIIQRKKQRQIKRILTLAIVVAGLIAVVLLIISAIKSVSGMIKRSIPTPTPTPVAIVSQRGTIQTREPGETPVQTELPAAAYAKLPEPAQQNDILSFIQNSDSQKKVCYLTFDDGPSSGITPQILDILRRYNIKATFFQVGSLIEEYPDMSRRVYEEGHLIGNHSYDHTYSKIYADFESFMNEFNMCADLIKEITGDDYLPIMRLPGGSYNTGTYGEIKQELKAILAENNIYYCDWNALNGDAEGSEKSTQQLLDRIKKTSKEKNQLVVLMHDAASKKQTAEALPAIIEYLISENYTFSRLDQPLF